MCRLNPFNEHSMLQIPMQIMLNLRINLLHFRSIFISKTKQMKIILTYKVKKHA